MALGDPSNADATPKYALVELERRWRVVPDMRPSLEGLVPVVITDRYLEGTRFRLRRMVQPNGHSNLKFAKKYHAEDAAARPMVNAYLTQAEYEVLAALPAFCISKRRYTIHHGGLGFSLDVFEDNLIGLEILEIETASRAELDCVVPPEWANMEITYKPNWQGGTLAQTQRIPED